jgi:transcriptional regulator with XRE-family HTH domain
MARRGSFGKNNFAVSTKEQDFLKRLGQKIRAVRHEKQMSLNQLSAQFGLEKSSISKLENGKSNSTVLTLWGLSEALNVPVERFFRG